MSETVIHEPIVQHQTPNLRASIEDQDPTLYELSRSDSSKFQRIKRAVWDEMIRRYADDPDQLAEITKMDSGLLHRLFTEVTKVDYGLAKQEGPQTPEDKGASFVELVNNPALSPERRAEILASAKAKLEADLNLVEEITDALEEDLVAGRAELQG